MRIAIADDHDMVRDGVKWSLDGKDDVQIVGEASTGHEAIRLLEHEQPDVMILDLRMGGTSGFDVLDTARRTGSPTRIVVMSMHDESSHVRRALALGASAYILKNSGRRELWRAIESVVAGDRYVQGDLVGALAEDDAASVGITDRERQILTMVAEGLENKQIARAIDLSEETVKSYLRNLFARWDVSSRAEAVAIAIRLGIIE